MFRLSLALLLDLFIVSFSNAVLYAADNITSLTLSNDRFYATVNKSTGAINVLTLDGEDLLGSLKYETPTPGGATGSGNSGIGPYLDCYCVPDGSYTPGSIAPRYQLFKGNDSTGTLYGGAVMSETYPPTGQTLEQYWFLRDGETGLHTFSRLVYKNNTTPFLRNLQEFRTLFRPNTPLWTHLSTNERQFAPLPSANATAVQVTVQDATWYLGNTPNDAYVQQESDYFTKYTFQDTWRNHDVHGLYSDGSTSSDGSTFGAWLVMNTKDTYFGGPLHSDLVVDGIVYNYIVSNHHGDGTPNITDGFDRTFGPQFYYFNKGKVNTSLAELRQDALQYASPSWNADFYDSIAPYVPNYVTTTQRTSFTAQVTLPPNASNAVAVLAQNHADFQDNVLDTAAYQYWVEVPASGTVTIPRVRLGLYRLTIYAANIFGQYIQDDIDLSAASSTSPLSVTWTEESAGNEVFRIGIPDRSSGEYRHGYASDLTHSLHPEQYRIYWAVYDFHSDFPDGVTFTVGQDDQATRLNYVHWSVFGGYADSLRSVPYTGNGDVNNWTVIFDYDKGKYADAQKATLTIQLAGAKTAAGNTDVFNASEPYTNLPYTVVMNSEELDPWIIPYYHSSSCAVRSAVICYNIAHKFEFETSLFVDGQNTMVLSLPFNATDYESAVLPQSVYVQYDALRLEVG